MSKYTAIIIEPRKHAALKFVLNNFLENLSDEWCIIIFHGTNNIEYVKNIIAELGDYQNRILPPINLNVVNLNAYTYSDILKNKDFYNNIPTDIFLVFQTDSIILKENKHLINDFLEYDYVGAPWKHDNSVGNGGLSLRKKNKMIEIINNNNYSLNSLEDTWFSLDLPSNINLNKPSFEKAKTFSIETVFYENPFGVHNFWTHLNETEKNIIFEKYPETKILYSLQHTI
jgi:hypothetical protein